MRSFPDRLILPPRTTTGRGTARALLAECARLGGRGAVVFGGSLRRSGRLGEILQARPTGLAILEWEHAGGEPTLDQVRALLEKARAFRAEWVAGIGGGSVLDVAKAGAGLLHAAQDAAAYHDGAPIERPGVAFVAVPTTAGTGSEATINSVLTNMATGAKKSIRDEALMARLVILDADLLAGCPPAVVAHSGMDALTQAVEAYGSRHATWLSDQLADQSLRLLAEALPGVYADRRAAGAEALLVGSYLAGLALSLARLGVVHGLAHPLGARYHQPHGLVCAVCLPEAIAFNRDAWGPKYGAMSAAVGGDLAGVVADLTQRLGIRSPFHGQPLRERGEIVAETLASGSTKANARGVTGADVERMLERLFR